MIVARHHDGGLSRMGGAFLLLLLAACAPAPKVTSAAVVEAFYASLLAQPILGAPDTVELARIAPWLTDTLQVQLRQARAIRDREAAAAPEAKPMFADEDLFTSLFEGPSSFYVMATQDAPTPAVLVRFGHGEGAAAVTWVDTVLVVRRDTSWVVRDIAFGGTWPMAARGTLEQRLRP